ncbi:hypothetical protein ACQY0O_007742 [Thecaphora frezii]
MMARLEEDISATAAHLLADSDLVLRSHYNPRTPESVSKPPPQLIVPPPETLDAVQSYIMRQYFLDHLDDPYPSQSIKDDIVKRTNKALREHPHYKKKETGKRELNDERLTLWYINARRRSGWQAIKKDFANDNKVRMGLLARTYLREQGHPVKQDAAEERYTLDQLINPGRDPRSPESEERIKRFKEKWEAMELYVKHGIKHKARDWMQDVIESVKEEERRAKTKKPGNKERKASTAATKPKVKPRAANAKAAVAKQTTRTSARLAGAKASGGGGGDYALTDSDGEAPATARPNVATFSDVQLQTPASLYASTNSLGLGVPSMLARGPLPSTNRDVSGSSDSSVASSLCTGMTSSTDIPSTRYGYSRSSSVTSFSSFDEALETLQAQVEPPKRPIRPLPSQASRKTKAVAAPSAAAEVAPPYPIASSPTNPQDVLDKFMHEQPSDSDCSPVAVPLLLPPTVDASNAFGYGLVPFDFASIAI